MSFFTARNLPGAGTRKAAGFAGSKKQSGPTADGAAKSASRCACGGGCPRCRVEASVQTKLAVSGPGDRHERQADHVADAVTAPGAPLSSARAPEIETMRPGDGTASALAVTLGALEGEGRALPDAERRFFESRLGRDLAGVRVHTDAGAAGAAQALQARAFTRGSDIYFGAGEFRPREGAGAQLLAHELVHTIQQAGSDPGAMPIMRAPPPAESAAAKKQREDALRDLKNVLAQLERCTAKGALCDREQKLPNGDVSIDGWGGKPTVESKAARDARMAQLVADLKHLQEELAAGPVAAGSFGDVKYPIGQGLGIFGGAPIDNVYFRDAFKRGMAPGTILLNDIYISVIQDKVKAEKTKAQKPKPKPAQPKEKQKVPPSEESVPPAHFEERLEDMIVVPDPEKAPLVYHKLSRYADNRGYIPNVFHDEHGYFYKKLDGITHVYLPGYKPGVEW